jgi:hypothetical protein
VELKVEDVEDEARVRRRDLNQRELAAESAQVDALASARERLGLGEAAGADGGQVGLAVDDDGGDVALGAEQGVPGTHGGVLGGAVIVGWAKTVGSMAGQWRWDRWRWNQRRAAEVLALGRANLEDGADDAFLFIFLAAQHKYIIYIISLIINKILFT